MQQCWEICNRCYIYVIHNHSLQGKPMKLTTFAKGVGASFLLLTVGIGAIAPVAMAAERVLGQTQLAYSENDRDALNLGSCQAKNNSRNKNVRALKFRALRGTADIASITVVYGNGRSERLNVRQKIQQGSETRWVNLKGGDRCITRIVVVGDTDNSSRREATLRVSGR